MSLLISFLPSTLFFLIVTSWVSLNDIVVSSKQFTWRDWWKNTVIYQIYPRSFMDSNGDGVGDLKGIISRLYYLKDIGIETIWITPIYESPMKDFGYDISNYTFVDPVFGTIDDFDTLINEMHLQGMKLIMDFVPNHTSDKHIWFQESKSNNNSTNPYKDYYVWQDPKDGCVKPNLNSQTEECVPNNWVSRFGGSVWEWVPERQQYYLHQFLKEQPDLNFRNPQVQKEMKDILRFWFDRGVDGWRIDGIRYLFEDESLADDPINQDFNPPPNHQAQYNSLIHTNTADLQQVHTIVKNWRADVFDKYSTIGNYRFMGTQSYGEARTLSLYYGSDEETEADFPFNFQMIKVDPETVTGIEVYRLVDDWITNIPTGKWLNWVFSHHGKDRIADRFGAQNQRAGLVLNLLLPGTPNIYYGEEIGMTNIDVNFEDIQDPWGKNNPCCWKKLNRDPMRSPMQWDTSKNAGFSKANRSWLPVHKNYMHGINVQDQIDDPFSTLNLFREILELRKSSPALQTNTLSYALVTEQIFSFLRIPDEEDAEYSSFLVAINFSNRSISADYIASVKSKSITFSNNSGLISISSNMDRNGLLVELNSLHLRPGEVQVIKVSLTVENDSVQSYMYLTLMCVFVSICVLQSRLAGINFIFSYQFLFFSGL